MTFDSVPWVVTMKKNEHYFPTVEWVKDASEPCGWRRTTFEGGQAIDGEGQDGVMAVGGGDESNEMDVDGGLCTEEAAAAEAEGAVEAEGEKGE